MAGQSSITPYNSFRILSYYNEARQLLNGEIPYPRMAILYPSYICNQNCVYCFYKKDINQVNYTNYDNFFKILDELKSVGVHGIELCGGGEPLANPEIHKILKNVFANPEYNFKWGLLTNGSLLTDDLIKIIIHNFAYIRISVDSLQVDRFMKIRQASEEREFYTIVSNIGKLIQWKKMSNNDCKVGIKYLALKYNADDIINFMDMAEKMQVDSIQVKVAEYGNQSYLDNSVFQYAEQFEGLINYLRDKISMPILATVRKTLLKKQCWMSPIQTTIDVNGDVYICCYFQHRRDTHKIGNILEQSMKEIWGSAKHREVIKNIEIEKCNTWNCRFHGYNEFMEKAVKDGLMQLEFA